MTCARVAHVSTSGVCESAHRDKKVLEAEQQAKAAVIAAESRADDAEARSQRSLEGRATLEHRRALDVQGWAADVTLLRKTIAAVDRCDPSRSQRLTR